MNKQLWYKLLGKESYKLNEKSFDEANYELDLGGKTKFSFNKSTGKVFFEDGKNVVVITMLELKKIINFVKKNGAV